MVLCVSCTCPYLSQALQSILGTISILCNRHTLKSHLQRTVIGGRINQNFNFHALQSLIGRIHCSCSSQIKLLQIIITLIFKGGGITPIGVVSRAATRVKNFCPWPVDHRLTAHAQNLGHASWPPSYAGDGAQNTTWLFHRSPRSAVTVWLH